MVFSGSSNLLIRQKFVGAVYITFVKSFYLNLSI